MQVIVTPIEKSLVLQAKGSEILILPDHVSVLKGLKKSTDFIEYFKYTSLLNRSARKLFEAWLKKDNSLWKKIYDTVSKMDDVEVTKVDDVSRVDRTVRNPVELEEPTKKQVKKPASSEKTSTKPMIDREIKEKPSVKKTPAKKAPSKQSPSKKAPTKKTTTKKATTKTAKAATKKKTSKVATKKAAAKKKTQKKKS